MIAIPESTRRIKGGTYTTYTATEATSDVTTAFTIDHGSWDVTVTVTIEEPAQEQDEPDTGERPTWERPKRRLATVTGLRRNRRTPQQAASTWG